MRALATPTGKSISVSVRVVRDVRAVRAGGRGEAKLRGSVRAAMIPSQSEAVGRKNSGAWRGAAAARRCPAVLGACKNLRKSNVFAAPGAKT